MLFRSRSLYLALLGVGYVLVGALHASAGGAFGVAVTLALVPGLVFWWAKSAPPARGEDWIRPVTRSALRAAGFGGALLCAAAIAPPGNAPFELASVVGGTFASVASLVALSRIAPLGGLFAVPKRAERLDAAWGMVVVGAAAAALCAARTLAPEGPIGPLATEVASAGAATMSLLIAIGHASRLRRLRLSDLGAHERLSASLKLAWAGLLIGVPVALLSAAPASRALWAAAWTVAFAMLAASVTRDPAVVGRAERVFVVAAVLGAPIAVVSALVEPHSPGTPLFAFALLSVGILVGLLSVRAASQVGKLAEQWTEAVREAGRVTMRSEPDTAIAAALSTLRQAFGPDVPAPELWQLHPPQRTVVDLAGYVQVQATEAVPQNLLDFAQGEPEQMLRTDVLERLEVRRADVRPPLEWMRARDAVGLMLLCAEEGPVGVLLLPRRAHADPLRLEEVRALRALGDRLAVLLAVSAAFARSRARELDARRHADQEDDRALRLEHDMATFAAMQEALSNRLAGVALVTAYSPAARRANEEVKRVAQMGAPLVLVTPPGIDPVPYAALMHRVTKARRGPLIVVDAADARDRLLSTWSDVDTSPLRLAQGGTICILAAAALPAEAQLFLARSLRERCVPGSATPLEMGVVVSVSTSVDALVTNGLLEAPLAQWLGDLAVSLPPWSARLDDQRAMLMDRIGRLGLRLRGRPMGLDPRALARLVEHEWPGNDVEINDVLTRAALVAAGDVVTVADLDQIGFTPLSHSQAPYAVGS